MDNYSPPDVMMSLPDGKKGQTLTHGTNIFATRHLHARFTSTLLTTLGARVGLPCDDAASSACCRSYLAAGNFLAVSDLGHS